MEMEENKSIELKLSDMWEILKRCWWLMIIVCVVVGGFSFLFMKINHTPTYSSTATLYVVRESASGKDTTSSDISIATQLVRDFNKLITSTKVLNYVRMQTGSMLKNEQLQSMVKITNPEDTRILDITVTAGDRESAQVLVNAFADAADQYFNELFQGNVNTSGAQSQQVVKIYDYGYLPEGISNPISMFKVAFIAMVGALLVYAVYFVLYLMDDKINDVEDVQKYLELSVLGEIPNRFEAYKRKEKYSNMYISASKKYTSSKQSSLGKQYTSDKQ